MIAANGVTARFLDARGFPSLRRVVQVARAVGSHPRAGASEPAITLPAEADSTALAGVSRGATAGATRITFADLSRTIIQLLGSGEYVVDPPGAEPPGHFGLAVRDYTHSTAPNRRYPDLVTQRLLKAALAGAPVAVRTRRARDRSRRTARARKTRRTRSSGRCASRRRRWSSASRIGEQFDAHRHRRVDQGDVRAGVGAADRRKAA